jgi:hypothetical protein
LALSDEIALAILIDTVTAAHLYAQKIDRRSGNVVELQKRIELHGGFLRISRCAKRVPAKLRKRLDAEIVPLVQQNPVDTEVIEAIFDAAVSVFTEYSQEEAAKTALAVLTYQLPGGQQYLTVRNDFAALSMADRIKAEKVLTAVGKKLKQKTTTENVFTALASALDIKRAARINSAIHELIVDYVAAVAAIWRSSGLKPSRAYHQLDPTYKSSFHSFADIILTAMVEPWVRRHDGNLDEVRQRTRLAHLRLPGGMRPLVSSALRQADVQWLVDEGHVKNGLRADSKNRHR